MFSRIKDPIKRLMQFTQDVNGCIYDFHLIQQASYIEECGVKVTQLVPIERLTPTVKRWMAEVGRDPKDVRAFNVTPNVELKKKLRHILMTKPALREIIERMYADDFRLYERVRCSQKR